MYCISISHKIAPIHIREKFALSIEEQKAFMLRSIEKAHVSGCVVLSTCNRSEFYFSGDKQAVGAIEQDIATFKGLKPSEMLKYYKIYEQEKAVQHLFSVASGLDSMILGEDEILGQVKKAYQLALEMKTTNFEINTVFQSAISGAKKVKSETLLSKTAISVGTLVAHEIFQFNKPKKTVLIIGMTGKVGTIIVKNIQHRKDVQIIGTTRQHGYTLNMAGDTIKVIPYSQRYKYLEEADIIISATTSPHYTLTMEEMKPYLSKHKERLFIDLAVPIDIDKAVSKIEDAKLYDIDYFSVLSKGNNAVKLKEVEKGRLIIQEEVDAVMKKLRFHEYTSNKSLYDSYWEGKNWEQILYELRDEANSRELTVILDVIERVARRNIEEKIKDKVITGEEED